MALFTNAIQVGSAAIADVLDYAQFHNGDPGGAGTDNVIAGGRAAIVMVAASGNMALDESVTKTGLDPLETVTHISFWSAASGGTCYGAAPRTAGDAATNAAGEYTLEAISIPGSSS